MNQLLFFILFSSFTIFSLSMESSDSSSRALEINLFVDQKIIPPWMKIYKLINSPRIQIDFPGSKICLELYDHLELYDYDSAEDKVDPMKMDLQDNNRLKIIDIDQIQSIIWKGMRSATMFHTNAPQYIQLILKSYLQKY
jgi:hypothetical protein